MSRRPARVELAECRLDDDADITLAEAWPLLDADERRRAERFVFPRDRDRFVRAHGFLRQRLGAVLGCAPQDLPIRGADGEKPYVADRPVEFSLSHSGSHAVVAITRDGAIGIDLEVLDGGSLAGDPLDGLAEVCLTPAERNALATVSDAWQARRFLSYWTAKEARMKLTGEGMALDPLDIALDLAGGQPVGYLRPHAPQAALRFVNLSRPDAVCCLAAASDVLEGVAS